VVTAVTAFADRVIQLRKAENDDKTMVDALLPFARTFTRRVADGTPQDRAWDRASKAAAAEEILRSRSK
jgi:dihydroxyacetone kinase